jgi:ribosomal protein L11 methyltransferase
VIAPTWTEIEDRSDRIIVRIEPNMAFGTGTHETTRLCLQAIDKHFKPGMSFLDIGTGTGILAIAAAKLAQKLGRDAGRIVACDTDPDAIKIACENASLNGVGDIIEFRVGSIDVDAFTPQPPPFDFICANLTLDTILPILDLLLERSGRLLVLSGILAEQLGRILNELDRRGIRNTSVRRDGEWIAVFNEAKAVR